MLKGFSALYAEPPSKALALAIDSLIHFSKQPCPTPVSHGLSAALVEPPEVTVLPPALVLVDPGIFEGVAQVAVVVLVVGVVVGVVAVTGGGAGVAAAGGGKFVGASEQDRSALVSLMIVALCVA